MTSVQIEWLCVIWWIVTCRSFRRFWDVCNHYPFQQAVLSSISKLLQMVLFDSGIWWALIPSYLHMSNVSWSNTTPEHKASTLCRTVHHVFFLSKFCPTCSTMISFLLVAKELYFNLILPQMPQACLDVLLNNSKCFDQGYAKFFHAPVFLHYTMCRMELKKNQTSIITE